MEEKEVKQIFQVIKHHFENRKFVIDYCSMCEYPLGFCWHYDKQLDVYRLAYDSGCDCETGNSEYLIEDVDDKSLINWIADNPERVCAIFNQESIYLC